MNYTILTTFYGYVAEAIQMRGLSSTHFMLPISLEPLKFLCFFFQYETVLIGWY